MELARKAGIAIVFGVPAIVGGGLAWQLMGNWEAVFIYLALLPFILLPFLLSPQSSNSADKHS
jgi:membrane protein implicated in regulation of membrane protease activity